MQKDYTYEIALTMLPGVGCQSARQLLKMVDSPEALFNLPKKDLLHLFGKHREVVDAILGRTMFHEVEHEMNFIEKNKIKPLYFTDPLFPQRLNRSECIDSPILLYYFGSADLNPERVISVVGTRRATDYGRDLTRMLIEGLKGENVTVVSGLALGIDSEAHESALATQLPTIGVLAHGLDRIYPSSNRNLAKRMIAQGGGLISEMKSETPIQPGLFPARNRIIAAMCDATIVVEASKKGGALITANIANGYQRDLFAFPGRIGDKYSEGCNAIIAACKAMMIRNADDLFINMGWTRLTKKEGKQTALFTQLDGDEAVIHNILSNNPEISTERISELCGLSLPKIATALLSLELKNKIRCLPGKIYKAL